MKHGRHYTLEEANARLGWVQERLELLRRAHAALHDEEAREALETAAPTNGGGEPGRVVSQAFLALRDGLGELQAAEIVLRDLERGLIDFPTVREGEEAYLCWEEGEEEIGWWHAVDAGHAGRRRL